MKRVYILLTWHKWSSIDASVKSNIHKFFSVVSFSKLQISIQLILCSVYYLAHGNCWTFYAFTKNSIRIKSIVSFAISSHFCALKIFNWSKSYLQICFKIKRKIFNAINRVNVTRWTFISSFRNLPRKWLINLNYA